MITLLTLLVLAAETFPSSSTTTWMEPEAFHLQLGDSRRSVESKFDRRGWDLTDEKGSLVHEYANGRTVVLDFRKDRLWSARFELVTFMPEQVQEWDDVRARLTERFGEPAVTLPKVLVFRDQGMEAHAVLSDEPDSELGQQGAARIVVRYLVPTSL